MIYRAYANRQEITEFPVNGVNTDEIWGGEVLLWKKQQGEYGEFECEFTSGYGARFGVRGENVEITWKRSLDETNSAFISTKKYGDSLSGIDYRNKDNYVSPGTYLSYAKVTGKNLKLHFENTALYKIYTPLPPSNVRNCSYIFANTDIKFEYVPEDIFKNLPYLEDVSRAFLRANYNSNPTSDLIPTDLFKYNTKLKKTDGTFLSIPAIKNIPTDLFKYNTELEDVSWLFNSCSNLAEVPANLFANCPKIQKCTGILGICENLKRVPNGFLNTQKIINAHYAFANCYNLTYVGSDVLANIDPYATEDTGEIDQVLCHTFQWDSNLTSAPNFYKRFPDLPKNKVYACYGGCTKLSFYSSLPYPWNW